MTGLFAKVRKGTTMFERLTLEARGLLIEAQRLARQAGDSFLGCEHLLQALAGSETPAGQALRAHRLTPAAVSSALRAGVAERADLDREALAAIGIDLEAVRERVEAAFGPGALSSSGERPTSYVSGRRLHQILRRRRRSRRSRHLPLTKRAKGCIEAAVGESQQRHDGHLGLEHLALALTATAGGAVATVFSAVHVDSRQLRHDIEQRYAAAA